VARPSAGLQNAYAPSAAPQLSTPRSSALAQELVHHAFVLRSLQQSASVPPAPYRRPQCSGFSSRRTVSVAYP